MNWLSPSPRTANIRPPSNTVYVTFSSVSALRSFPLVLAPAFGCVRLSPEQARACKSVWGDPPSEGETYRCCWRWRPHTGFISPTMFVLFLLSLSLSLALYPFSSLASRWLRALYRAVFLSRLLILHEIHVYISHRWDRESPSAGSRFLSVGNLGEYTERSRCKKRTTYVSWLWQERKTCFRNSERGVLCFAVPCDQLTLAVAKVVW